MSSLPSVAAVSLFLLIIFSSSKESLARARVSGDDAAAAAAADSSRMPPILSGFGSASRATGGDGGGGGGGSTVGDDAMLPRVQQQKPRSTQTVASRSNTPKGWVALTLTFNDRAVGSKTVMIKEGGTEEEVWI